ncbi:putative serine/threonine-protein kinase [Manihot esculenta]|uniref:Uncharacterized protein n=1 Tax=Manihot esculenta TaxID=3983 RepID=A0ACB7GU30_MANES|nr:putative serine/threonine-protein kinase [Manihot esculenta]KAG8643486.1 hypothetical protein MANES_11G041166v8 [Manihot esculenta]
MAEPSRGGVHKYSFEELAKATGDFSNNNRVGQDGSGEVYEGTLPNGKQVAIKRLQYNSDPEKQQVELLFENEVKTNSRTRHPNIVEVVGYCSEEADRLIVYEFVSNKSLKSHLYVGRRQLATAPIDWPTRMKIALGIAEGLAYLHEECKSGIIHRDIKSDNILLDDKFNPKIRNFGISKEFADSKTHVSTVPMGTPDYLAPEHYTQDDQNKKLTDKSDVFSFGVVLLELITGKLAAFEKERREYIFLTIWAVPLLKQILDADYQDLDAENCKELFDSKLPNNFEKNDMEKLIYSAAACIYKPAKLRPHMCEIVKVLNGDMEPKTIWVRSDCKYLYNGSPYAPFPQAQGTSSS